MPVSECGQTRLLSYLTNVLELVESGGSCHKSRSRYAPTFKHAAPRFKNLNETNKAPNPPYKGAPGWKCSVYYYWWLYLRYNHDYRETCANNGIGACSDLYRDFGNVYGLTFRAWWAEHNYLFKEPVAAALKSAQHNFGEGAQVVDVQIDVSLGAEAVERSLKELHTQLLFPERVALYRSAAIYPVVRRPVLTNLHRHLAVYKWHKRFPDMADEEIADRVGYHAAAQANGISRSHLLRLGHSTREIDIELRRSKRKAVQHDLRCAHMLIEGVGRGEFPVRTNA